MFGHTFSTTLFKPQYLLHVFVATFCFPQYDLLFTHSLHSPIRLNFFCSSRMSTAYHAEKLTQLGYRDAHNIHLQQNSLSNMQDSVVAVNGCLLLSPDLFQTYISAEVPQKHDTSDSIAFRDYSNNESRCFDPSLVLSMEFLHSSDNDKTDAMQSSIENIQPLYYSPNDHASGYETSGVGQNKDPNVLSFAYLHPSRQSELQQTTRLRRNAVFIPRTVSDTICQFYNQPPDSEPQVQCMRKSRRQSKENVDSSLPTLLHRSPSEKSISRGYDSSINALLYEWLYSNIDHPFPSALDKQNLMSKTGLTKMQLKNWLCNVRRRKLSKVPHRSRKSKYVRDYN